MGIADAVKPSSASTVKALQRMGLEVIMLTGDNRQTAEAIASQVNIKRVIADLLPYQKAQQVQNCNKKAKLWRWWEMVLMMPQLWHKRMWG
jgi:Cu+-exporting ATPase